MPAIEVGRVCIKTMGREDGKKCVIVNIIDKSFVLITGPKSITGVKRRRVNVRHLKPTQESIEVTRGASDEEVIDLLRAKEKNEIKTAKMSR